jgi:hypothetical protein
LEKVIAERNGVSKEVVTLSAWIHSTDIERTQPIVAKAKGNWVSYMLRINDGGRLELAIENHVDTHWETKARLTSKRCTTSPSRDRTKAARRATLYIDGIEQESEMVRNNNYGPTFRIGYTKSPLTSAATNSPRAISWEHCAMWTWSGECCRRPKSRNWPRRQLARPAISFRRVYRQSKPQPFPGE